MVGYYHRKFTLVEYSGWDVTETTSFSTSVLF